MTGGQPEAVRVLANTNLLCPLTIIPMIKQRLEPGIHTVITWVLGQPGGEKPREIPYPLKVSSLENNFGPASIEYLVPDKEKGMGRKCRQEYVLQSETKREL